MKSKNILTKLMTQIPINELTEIAGPRPFSAETRDFQSVIWQVLDEKSDIKFSHNVEGELVASWHSGKDEKTVNISSIMGRVAFDQITLSESDQENYLHFLKTKSKFVHGKAIYSMMEKSGQADLHISEKVAINAYTKQFYIQINDFLRKSGKSSTTVFEKLAGEQFQLKVKDLLCLTVFAASGLNKIADDGKDLGFRAMTLKSEQEAFFVNQVQTADQKGTVTEKAFMSTSDFFKDAKFGASPNFFVLVTRGGKRIKDYSSTPREEEALIAPGTHIKYHIYQKEEGSHYMVLQPVLGVLSANDKVENVSGDENYVKELKEHLDPRPIPQVTNIIKTGFISSACKDKQVESTQTVDTQISSILAF